MIEHFVFYANMGEKYVFFFFLKIPTYYLKKNDINLHFYDIPRINNILSFVGAYYLYIYYYDTTL